MNTQDSETDFTEGKVVAFENRPEAIAIAAVAEYTDAINQSKSYDTYDRVDTDMLHVTWHAYIAGNWKSMVMWDDHDEYFEVTYISKENLVVVDAYTKHTDSLSSPLYIWEE